MNYSAAKLKNAKRSTKKYLEHSGNQLLSENLITQQKCAPCCINKVSTCKTLLHAAIMMVAFSIKYSVTHQNRRTRVVRDHSKTQSALTISNIKIVFLWSGAYHYWANSWKAPVLITCPNLMRVTGYWNFLIRRGSLFSGAFTNLSWNFMSYGLRLWKHQAEQAGLALSMDVHDTSDLDDSLPALTLVPMSRKHYAESPVEMLHNTLDTPQNSTRTLQCIWYLGLHLHQLCGRSPWRPGF